MQNASFTWCDLSAYQPGKARSFYSNLFGWSYNKTKDAEGTSYWIGSTPKGEAAGLFEMPDKFKQIQLPSFWMPYIRVEDIGTTIEMAKTVGAIVEVEPTAFDELSKIALVRDPLGAGFTLYEGPDLGGRKEIPGHMVWNALYVSDAKSVIPFYRNLLGWDLKRESEGHYSIRNHGGETISAIYEVGEEIRGKYQFWANHFQVDDIVEACRLVHQEGGKVIYKDDHIGRPTVLCYDMDGAAFFLTTG